MKIEMSSVNIKGILSRLSVLKTNPLLLGSIIIALVAMLLFIPVNLVNSSLKKAVEQKSLRLASQVKSAKRTAISKDQGKELARQEAMYENDANQIALLAIQSTQRPLLRYGIFPEPSDQSSAIFKMFGDNYRQGINALLLAINANDCPTDAELSQGVVSASATSPGGAPRQYSAISARSMSGSYGRPSGGARPVEETILDEICLSRAKSISVYASLFDLPGYAFWGEYTYDVRPEDAIADCWYYQLGYWVIEDIVSTIGSMNSGSTNVLTAPVKRLIEVSFKRTGGGRAKSSTGPAGNRNWAADTLRAARPHYVGSDMSGSMTDSFTGRFSDNDIDVIHFNLSVVISAKSVLPFMKELCSIKRHKFKGFFDELPDARTFAHNQITILQSKFYSVDRLEPFHGLYRYGQDAVVELKLVCEYVFKKSAYDVIKPAAIKGGGKDAAGQRPTLR